MLLNETIVGKGKLHESTEKLPKGVLARVTYNICNLGEKNANGRVYGREVWEKVLADSELQNKLKNRTLYGHAEHPNTSQSNLECVSHVIHKMWMDEKNVWQTFDVLDTPGGRIVNTLLLAECQVGCSTRAEGELEEVKEGDATFQRVIPDKYKYCTTDTTADPSTSNVMPLSVTRNVVTEIKKILSECTKPEEKQFVEKVLESMKIENKKETKKDESVVHIVSDPSQSKVNVGGGISSVAVDSDKAAPVEVTITTPDAVIPVPGPNPEALAGSGLTLPAPIPGAGETPVPPTPDTALDAIVADEGPEHEDAETEEEETEEHEGPNPEEEKDEDEEVEESKLTEILRVDMVAKVTENGGYLEGAARQDVEQDVFDRKYWNLDDNDDFQLVELKDVPIDIAKRLEKQGTSAQGFKDGYEAAKAASAYYNESKTNESFDEEETWEYEEDEPMESEDEDAEPTEPQPEDIVYFPSGPLGSRYSVSVVEGDFIGEFDDYEQVAEAIKAYMKQHKFYPTVWSISDHGNAEPDTDIYQGMQEAKKKAKGKPKMGGGNGVIGGVKKVSKKNEGKVNEKIHIFNNQYQSYRGSEVWNKLEDQKPVVRKVPENMLQQLLNDGFFGKPTFNDKTMYVWYGADLTDSNKDYFILTFNKTDSTLEIQAEHPNTVKHVLDFADVNLAWGPTDRKDIKDMGKTPRIPAHESKTPKQEIMDLKLSEASMKAERDKAFERLEAMSKVKSALDSAKKSNIQLESKLALSTKELDGLKNLLENKTKENKDLLYKNKELQVNTKTLQEKLDKEIYNHKEDILEAETRVRKEVLKAYFDSQIKESQLNVQDNILALLEDCNSIDDVNDLLSKAVQVGRRTLLSNPVKKAIVERSHPETDRKRDETFELMDSFNNTKRV